MFIIFLILLALTGVGVFIMGLPLPNFPSFSGNLVCELFMTIFNIHFLLEYKPRLRANFWESTKFTFYLSYSIYAHCKRIYDSPYQVYISLLFLIIEAGVHHLVLYIVYLCTNSFLKRDISSVLTSKIIPI